MLRELRVGFLIGAVVMGLYISSAFAMHCPALVKECEALVGKLENSPKADTAQVAAAKQGCADAMQLHNAGNHADSVIKVGEAITLAGKAVK